jgi:hypothetical protein
MLLHEQINYKVAESKTLGQVSVSIDDRWQVLITNVETGQVRIYNKDVLDALYYSYSALRAYTQEDRKP